MIRAWLGVALLAVSWLLGWGYYFPASPVAWLVVVVAGASLLSGIVQRMPSRRDMAIAAVLLMPAVWFAPWPLRAAPLLIALGLLFELLPLPRRWPVPLGRGTVAAGVVMLTQALAMWLYTQTTARSHDLPAPVAGLFAGLVRLLGTEATADGSEVVMHTVRQPHRFAVTWDSLVDPATICFYVGSLVVLALVVWSRLPEGRRWNAWIAGLRALTILVAAWLPVRAALMLAFYLDRVVRWQFDMPLHAMNHFFSPWVLLLMLAGPVLLAWRFVRIPTDEPTWTGEESLLREPQPWHFPLAAVLVALAAAVLVFAYKWDPVGTRKQGRVKFVARHSTWEPIDKPYDTNFFGHDSGYSYAAIYAYLGQFYEMSQLAEDRKIDAEALADCDVLVIKTPSETRDPPYDENGEKYPSPRYSEDEVRAVVKFVEDGGGLLLIGDHTNVFNMNTYLNDITRHFGFTYRHDLLFSNEQFEIKPGRAGWNEQESDPVYLQRYLKPRVSHPAVQHLPPTDFAVSCSIDPGRSWGKAAMIGTGLWSLPPAYHLGSNYHTFPQHAPEMRYGAFIQLWATRPGKGRVLAFTDSTILSTFCIYQPGKAELMLGMIEWLNHRSTLRHPVFVLLPLGCVLLIAGLFLARRREAAWLLLLAAATLGWVFGGAAVIAWGRMRMPVPKVERPMTRVVIDRTTSDVSLSKGAYAQNPQGFGMFEQWISRVHIPVDGELRGSYTARRTGLEAFSGDAVVVVCPTKPVTCEFRDALVKYVREDGGKLLVIDSPESGPSTANSLLSPFGLSVVHDMQWEGFLSLGEGWPTMEVEYAYEIAGGEPIAWMGEKKQVFGARVRFDSGGQVMALGFAGAFHDGRMGDYGDGAVWMTDPDETLLNRYDVLFALVRTALTGEPVGPPPIREKQEKPSGSSKEADSSDESSQ